MFILFAQVFYLFFIGRILSQLFIYILIYFITILNYC